MAEVDPVDVLIITAADGEDKAVLAVEDGGIGTWQKTPGPAGYGFAVWLRSFQTPGGAPLKVALSHAYQMGEAAVNAAARLADVYKPQCLAMCGVCAGNPKRTRLGDVIIADRVWKYDSGSIENPGPDGKPVFRADAMVYPFHAQWTQAGQNHRVPEDAPWLNTRPVPRDLQELWVLRELLDGRDPLGSPERERFCQDWKEAIQSLEGANRIVLNGGRLALTDAGGDYVQRALTLRGGDLPKQPPWQIVVGPLGTGSKLVKDVTIWDELEIKQRHIAGLDMEGSFIGLTAHIQGMSMMVVKGVMDYAEPGRTQGFRQFAARASAEVLIGFLRQHLRPAGPDPVASAFAPTTCPTPQAGNPSALLNARCRVVNFSKAIRQRELDELKTWCASPDPMGMRLFVGPGGIGKTRLFIEWAEGLAKDGWRAGFLREGVETREIQALRDCPDRLFLVVDYAEARANLTEILRELAARRSDLPVLRVALLAREAADWWRALVEKNAALAGFLLQNEPFRLEPVPEKGQSRQEVFAAACEDFAKVREQKTPAATPDLSDPHFGRVLYLHMAALAAVEGLPLAADSLLNEILAHEERFWLHLYANKHPADILNEEAFAAGARRVVAAATLLGGLPDGDAVAEMIRKVDGPAAEHFPRFLQWLYPGRGQGEDQDAYVGPLEPDLLGEGLVSRVLSDKATPRGFLEGVFAGAPPLAMATAFRVLGRIGVERSDARSWIGKVLKTDVPGRALPAFAAAISLGKETAFSPLGEVLAEALTETGTLELADAIEPHLPEQSVSLAEVAAWVTGRRLESLPKDDQSEECLKERARLANNLGVRLGNLGRHEEALEAAREAVAIRRDLATKRPDAFLPYLAMSLGNLGNILGDLHRHKDALDVAREAVAVYRDLATNRPDAFLPYLAGSLNNLGNMLSEVGGCEEALDAAREAVTICRDLATKRPDAFLPYLATSLNNLGNILSNAGRREEALEAALEAVRIYRDLARKGPDAFLPDLAMSLNNLCNRQGALGRREEALEAVREAVVIYTTLVERIPQAFAQYFMTAVRNLAKRLKESGRAPETEPVLVQAQAVAKRLFPDQGGAGEAAE